MLLSSLSDCKCCYGTSQQPHAIHCIPCLKMVQVLCSNNFWYTISWKKISHTGFRACSLFLKNVNTRGSCGLSAIAELLVDTATDTTRNLENIEHMPLAHRCHSLFVGSVLMQAVDHSASEKWFSYNHERRPTVRSLQWETNLFIHLLWKAHNKRVCTITREQWKISICTRIKTINTQT